MDRFTCAVADWDLAHLIESPADPWIRPVLVRGLRPSAERTLAAARKLGISTDQVIAATLAALAAENAGAGPGDA